MNKRQYKKYKKANYAVTISIDNMLPIVLQEKVYNHIKNNLPSLISKMNYYI